MDEITLDDKTYISSKRAAEITGYARDYVGQLCRSGVVDARLVGRNWFVLEASIREHRFGSQEEKEPTAEESTQNESAAAWDIPTYVSEPVEAIPTVDRGSIEAQGPLLEEGTHDMLNEMQEAWQEWFTRKQEGSSTPLHTNSAAPEPVEEPVMVAEEVIEEVSPPETVEVTPEPIVEPVVEAEKPIIIEEDAVPVAIHTPPQEVSKVEEPVVIRRTFVSTPVPQPEARVISERITKRNPASVSAEPHRSTFVPQFLMLTAAGAAIVMVFVSSGYVDQYLTREGTPYSAIRVLGGVSMFDK